MPPERREPGPGGGRCGTSPGPLAARLGGWERGGRAGLGACRSIPTVEGGPEG